MFHCLCSGFCRDLKPQKSAELLFRCSHINSYSSSRTLQAAERWNWTNTLLDAEYCYDTSVRPYTEDPQCMRSGDILLARYQSSDRSIIPHRQQRNIMQLSVCEKKRLRFGEIKDLDSARRSNTERKAVSKCWENKTAQSHNSERHPPCVTAEWATKLFHIWVPRLKPKPGSRLLWVRASWFSSAQPPSYHSIPCIWTNDKVTKETIKKETR